MKVRWWPRAKPLPAGWTREPVAPSHHDEYSVLIRQGKRKKRAAPEASLHRQVAAFLARALPRDAWWTTFPAGGGGRVRGAQLRRAGLKAGVPDILIVHRGTAHWIELKAKKGRISDVQIATNAALVAAGCRVHVARSVDDVALSLQQWGIPLTGRLT